MGAGAFRGSENRAQIVGIGQLVTDDDEGRFPTGGGLLQNVVDGHIGMGGGQGDDALMGPGEGHGVQLPAVYGHHHGAGFLRLGGKPL